MSATKRCGGSKQIERWSKQRVVDVADCPGCEDCRPTYNKPPLGRPIPPGDPERDRDTEQSVPATHGNIAPAPTPVEALARRMETAAMLRTLDRECDRLRAILAECRELADDDSYDAMQAAHTLGRIVGTITGALATDARTVDRG